jgi:tetratricopeptide (TPR) repeat protein
MPLVRAGFVTQWYDGDIQAGTEWAEEVYAHLNTADIILLLISPDFMNSDFCYHVEMTRALERHTLEEALVIPILLRPTYWKDTLPDKLQVLPRGEKPVSTWRNRDQAFLGIAKDIFAQITLLLSQRWLEQVNTFYDTQQYNHALQASEKAIRFNPKNVSAYLSRGALYWQLKRYEDALDTYERVIELDADNIIAHMSKCYALWVLGRYQIALQSCERAILLHPENTILYLLKGQLHELLRDQAYQKARQLGGAKAEYLDQKYLIMQPKDAFAFSAEDEANI